MAELYEINGRVIDRSTQQGISNLRVEVWDKDLIASDLLGRTVTDDQGAFYLEFGEKQFLDLFLDHIPDVFIKLFRGPDLIHNSSTTQIWHLEPGENDIALEIEGARPADSEDFLFYLFITRPTDVYSEPGAKIIDQLKPGESVGAIAIEGEGYRIRTPQQSTGWVDHKDLDDLRRRLDFFNGMRRVEPILPEEVLDTVNHYYQESGATPGVKYLLEQVRGLNNLLAQAQGVLRYNLEAIARFDTMLALFVESANPPPRPQNFNLSSLRDEAEIDRPGIPGTSRNNRSCRINLDGVQLLGTAILRSASRRTPTNSAAVNDQLWAGYWVMGNMLHGANHLDMLRDSITQGDSTLTSLLERTPIAGPTAVENEPLPQSIQPISGYANSPVIEWEPGRFPGVPLAAGFECMVEPWERVVRAVRCCGQTYRIDSITRADGAEASFCPGTEITITGEGFRGEREWPLHDPTPMSPFPPIRYFSRVLFPAAEGYVEVEEGDYIAWGPEFAPGGPPEGSSVTVRIPDGAVSGQVEMRILCEETLGRRPTGQQCGIQTRLPIHDPNNAEIIIAEGSLSVSVGAGGSSSSIEADACAPVEIEIIGENLTEVTIMTSDGESVDFPVGAAGDPRPIVGRKRVYLAHDETYTISATDGCGGAYSQVVRVNRCLVTTLSVPGFRFDAASDRAIPLTVQLSCTPAMLGLSELEVSLDAVAGNPGITIRDPILDFSSDQITAETTIDVLPAACGMARVRAVPDYREATCPGTVEFDVLPQPVRCTFTGSLSVDIRSTNPLSLNPPPPYFLPSFTATLTFRNRGGRSAVDVSFAPLSFSSVGITQTGGGAGTYDCATGQISIPSIDLLIDAPWPIDDTVVSMAELSTETISSPSGLFPVLSGLRVDSAGNVAIVGTGIGRGGLADGADIALNAVGTLSPLPPPCCAE